MFSSRWWGWFHNTILEEDHVGLSCYGSYAYVRAYGEGSLAEIASALGIPKTTAVERLKTATSTGVVIKDAYGHYVLSLKSDVCVNVESE